MSSQSGNQLVFGYWAIRGLAEPTRLALRYRNVPFEDKLYVQGEAPEYSRDAWLSAKFTLGLGKFLRIVCLLQRESSLALIQL